MYYIQPRQTFKNTFNNNGIGFEFPKNNVLPADGIVLSYFEM